MRVTASWQPHHTHKMQPPVIVDDLDIGHGKEKGNVQECLTCMGRVVTTPHGRLVDAWLEDSCGQGHGQ